MYEWIVQESGAVACWNRLGTWYFCL